MKEMQTGTCYVAGSKVVTTDYCAHVFIIQGGPN